MIKYNLERIKERALSIANKYYPQVQCVILTGSQLEPDFLYPQSDVDIVLIDDRFSGISSDGAKEGDYKVDFTRLSHLSLANLLLENSYSMNPVMLYMLKDGVILKDDTGIGLLAQEFLKNNLIGSGNKNYQNDVRSLKISLTKLKKHLSNELDSRFNMFLMCDFLHLIATSYLFCRDEGWAPNDGFRQVKNILVKEPDSPFLADVIQQGMDYLADPVSNKDSIVKHIDNWLARLSGTRSSVTCSKRFIVNFNFKNQRKDVFYKNICYAIMIDLHLSPYFIMGQIHYYGHIFKHSYSLFFDTEMVGYDESALKKRLESLFSRQKRRVLDLCVVNPAYIDEIMCSEAVYKHVESWLSFIDKEIIYNVATEGEYNSNKMFLAGLILSVILFDKFNLSPDKVIVLSDFLSNRWIPEAYLQHVKYDKFEAKRKAYDYRFSSLFNTDKQIFDVLRQVFIQKNVENSFDELNWSKVEKLSSSIYEEVEAFISKSKLPDLYLASLTRLNQLSYEDKTRCWFLINSIEWMLNVLGVDVRQRSYFAYSLSKLYDISSWD